MLNQWRFDWYPLDTRQGAAGSRHAANSRRGAGARSGAVAGASGRPMRFSPIAEVLAPWARGGGITWRPSLRRWRRSWPETRTLDTAPFSGGYGMRGAARAARRGRPAAAERHAALSPGLRRALGRRRAQAGSQPSLAAAPRASEFEEPHPGPARERPPPDAAARQRHAPPAFGLLRRWRPPAGRRRDLCHRRLSAASAGAAATGASSAPMAGAQPAFGIRAVISDDGGDSWDVDRTIGIRGDLPNRDLGYPCTVMAKTARSSPSTTARIATASPASWRRAGGSRSRCGRATFSFSAQLSSPAMMPG